MVRITQVVIKFSQRVKGGTVGAILVLASGLVGCLGRDFSTIHPVEGSTSSQTGTGAGAGSPEDLLPLAELAPQDLASVIVSGSENYRAYSVVRTRSASASASLSYRWSYPAVKRFGKEMLKR